MVAHLHFVDVVRSNYVITIRNSMKRKLRYCLFEGEFFLIKGIVKKMLRITLSVMPHEGAVAEIIEHVNKDRGLEREVGEWGYSHIRSIATDSRLVKANHGRRHQNYCMPDRSCQRESSILGRSDPHDTRTPHRERYLRIDEWDRWYTALE